MPLAPLGWKPQPIPVIQNLGRVRVVALVGRRPDGVPPGWGESEMFLTACRSPSNVGTLPKAEGSGDLRNGQWLPFGRFEFAPSCRLCRVPCDKLLTPARRLVSIFSGLLTEAPWWSLGPRMRVVRGPFGVSHGGGPVGRQHLEPTGRLPPRGFPGNRGTPWLNAVPLSGPVRLNFQPDINCGRLFGFSVRAGWWWRDFLRG